ncbi:MAG: polysaccharide biosynthesis tyrosine autokinase, partial [Acidimicrobiales bacterium]
LVVGASVAGSMFQTSIYRSSADILLQARTTESIFDPTLAALSLLEPPTEIRVLESEPVRRIVEQRIGSAPAVSVSNPADTHFLVVTAESPEPARAAEIANAYAQAYVDFRRQRATEDLQAAVAQLESKVDELEDEISAVEPSDPARDALVRDRDLFASRIGQLRLALPQQTGGAQQSSQAVALTTPVRPTPARNAMLALVVGLVLGIGLAFLRDYLDDSLKSKDDVGRVVPGVPVLGLIPALADWKDKRSAMVISVDDPKSPAAEAYRSLRTTVQFLGLERSLRTLHVTSPSAAEGKSTTIANLAVALAGAGRRIVVVDADLRRPRLHAFFGLRQEIGLTSVLIGETTLDDAVQHVSEVPGLDLLASGPVPPNPSELLAGAKCADQLRELAERYDLVLVDCPPCSRSPTPASWPAGSTAPCWWSPPAKPSDASSDGRSRCSGRSTPRCSASSSTR